MGARFFCAWIIFQHLLSYRNMKSIQFWGAAGDVTGSNFVLTANNGDQVMVDIGMAQGSREAEDSNFKLLDYDIANIKAVLITHAHLDHIGKLPILAKMGFNGPIYCTEPTKQIAEISLMDSVHISKEDGRGEMAYTEDEATKILSLMKLVEYDEPVSVFGFTATYRNAGHILGSASIEVSHTDDPTQNIIFSGDLGNSPQDLIPPTTLIDRATTVVMESTYGDSVHPVEDVKSILLSEINEIEKSDGVLLIPAFSIERTQELLHILDHLKNSGEMKEETPVYLDSPMAIRVTRIFEQSEDLYNLELKHDETPFGFAGLAFTLSSGQSKAITEHEGAKVIIAGSGMMSGGRIMHHLKRFISHESTRILIVGYQAEGTLGREIEEGADTVHIDDGVFKVKAHVTRLHSMSSHADQPRLMKWLSHIKDVNKIFLVHGENPQREALAEKITSDLGYTNITMPMVGEEFDVE